MSGRNLQIPTAEVFIPLLEPARYKGLYGGRGSAKSHFFAELLVDDALRAPGELGEGLLGLCVREIQKSLKRSAKHLIEKKLVDHKLGEKDGFKVFDTIIKTPKDGLIDFTGMQDHTADSVKSYEGFHRAWIEEAQSLSASSLSLLRPTIRWENERLGAASEIWASWNPRRAIDPIDVLLRKNTPSNSTVIRSNWSDNPWFPKVLEQERLDCLANEPDQYDHVWDGGYLTVMTGAYFAKLLLEAKMEGRICRVPRDPLFSVRLFMDIGGTGAKSDAFSIWAVQFIGREIMVLDYYESVGQPMEAHCAWLRERGYTPGRAEVWLPHDGKQGEKVFATSFETEFKRLGYKTTIVPNQGRGAAKARIEAARKLFPSMVFDAERTESGRQALGWYHEKKDDNRNIGLGPDHDWSSHGADSFGMMALCYKPPTTTHKPITVKRRQMKDSAMGY